MTHTNSTPALTPPGWPDPLESPQAEAIRNGKLDDTEIRNLFDCMERELRLHRERAANPAQVTDAMVEAATKELLAHGEFSSIPGNNEPNARIAARAALTAAIGAGVATGPISETTPVLPTWGGQAVASVDDVAARLWKADAEDSGTPASVAKGRTREAFDDQSDGLKDRWRKFANAAFSALTHPAPSGQAVAVESYNFPRTIAEAREALEGINEWLGQRQSGEATTNSEAAIFQRVHSALQNIDAFALADLSNPPAQPGWRLAPMTPTQEMMDAADRARPLPESYVYEIWGAMLSAAPLPGGEK